MSDSMIFPKTVDEFMERYKMVDTEQIYSNGTEYVPIFRMKQWFEHLPSTEPERKTGKWKEKEVFTADESKSIDEWQSCCCSECGRYDTSPYMYFFKAPNYCSWCGAKMEGEEDDK